MADYVKARSSFAVGRRIVGVGDTLPDNDPIIKGRESLFRTLDGEPVKPKRATRKAVKADDDENDEG